MADFFAVSRVISEEKRLRAQEREAQESLREAHRLANEAMARLERLRIQRESLVRRGADMVNEGLASLDAAEDEERRGHEAAVNRSVAEESEAAVEVQQHGGFGVIDWGSVAESADVGFADWLNGGAADSFSALPGSSSGF